MAYPPASVPSDKSNATNIADDHPGHHNTLASAVNDVVAELGTGPKGAAADLTARLSALDTTVAGKLSALTPWTADIDAATFDLRGLGVVEIGPTAPTVNTILSLDYDRTTTTAATHNDVRDSSTTTFNTTAGGNFNGLAMLPIISGDANIADVKGILFQPTMNPATTITSATGGFFSLNHGVGTLTTGTAIYAKVQETLGTLTTGIGVDVVSANTAGTFTTMIGLRITNLAGGSTVWAMQVGDYQSYHHGKLTLGATTAPTYALDIKGTAQDRGVIALTETATPTNPASSSQVLIYAKSDAIVFGFNDAGTMRYKSLTLSGTGVTWVHSTTAP